jgi:hypothetical protein
MVSLHICSVDVVRESTPPLEARKLGSRGQRRSLRMHICRLHRGRAVGAAAIDELFPAGDNVIPGLR